MSISTRVRTGFTLIELLIVIAIISILSALFFTNFNGARERARDSRRKTDLTQLKSALQLYYNDFGGFPNSGAGSTIAGCGAAGKSVCSWTSGSTAGSAFSAGNPAATYMGVMPGDPLSPTQQYAYATSATVDYVITATLENASDQDAARSQSRCGVAAGSIQAKVFMVCNQ